jgi:hypothetical protein
MHRPSAAKLWHSPAATVLPMPFPFPLREEPLELQETSYLAASARIFSLSMSDIAGAILISIAVSSLFSINSLQLVREHMF